MIKHLTYLYLIFFHDIDIPVEPLSHSRYSSDVEKNNYLVLPVSYWEPNCDHVPHAFYSLIENMNESHSMSYH
jgi:hypothetical protein